MSNRPILVADNVEMTFSDSESPLEAIAEANLQVASNEFVCLIGPSGCGKSTLLRILAGLVAPTAGRVLLNGEPLREPSSRIGFVFQHANLMPWRSTIDNVTLPLDLAKVPRDEARQRASELLELVGLAAFHEAFPRNLSGGMRQRVALARALVYDPDVLLLDEPFGALDALSRERMSCELLRIWQARRKTVIMVTHNIQEAIFLADRVLTMSPRPGRIEQSLSVDLPRPRCMEALYDPHFGDLARELRQSLRVDY